MTPCHYFPTFMKEMPSINKDLRRVLFSIFICQNSNGIIKNILDKKSTEHLIKQSRKRNELFDQSKNSISHDYYAPPAWIQKIKKYEDRISLFYISTFLSFMSYIVVGLFRESLAWVLPSLGYHFNSLFLTFITGVCPEIPCSIVSHFTEISYLNFINI